MREGVRVVHHGRIHAIEPHAGTVVHVLWGSRGAAPIVTILFDDGARAMFIARDNIRVVREAETG